MRFRYFIRRAELIGAVALVALTAAFAPNALAQKKGGGGGGGSVDTSTIYFINGAGGGYNTNYVWTMDSTGDNVTQLGYWGVFNSPSRASHNVHRWFLTCLTIPNEFYPDGSIRMEVFAIRGDYDNALNNNSETRVQLTDDPTLQPYFGWFQGMQWTPGDLGASFKARRWDGAVPVDGGLYTVGISYGADGNVVGSTTVPNKVLDFPLDANGSPAFGRHSWGSSNTKVAYVDSSGTELWVADLSAGTRTRIYAGSVYYLDWAQDGSKIVFGSGTIRTIRPDGGGLKAVLGPRYVNGVYSSGFGHAYFSPTAGQITCVGIMNLPGGGTDNDVIRCTSTGGSLTNLTNTPSLVEVPVGWR